MNLLSRIFNLKQKTEGTIKRKFYRHYLGRIFSTLVKIILDLDCYNSQCGSKLFRKELLDKIFSEKFISKWIFDLEIILRLKDSNIIEYPVNQWIHKDGSKVKVFMLALKTFKELFNIRKKYL